MGSCSQGMADKWTNARNNWKRKRQPLKIKNSKVEKEKDRWRGGFGSLFYSFGCCIHKTGGMPVHLNNSHHQQRYPVSLGLWSSQELEKGFTSFPSHHTTTPPSALSLWVSSWWRKWGGVGRASSRGTEEARAIQSLWTSTCCTCSAVQQTLVSLCVTPTTMPSTCKVFLLFLSLLRSCWMVTSSCCSLWA